MSSTFAGTPVRLGVITDIQYADKPDYAIDLQNRPPDAKQRFRSYSTVLEKTRRAILHLNESVVAATLHLGDIIDGNVTLDKSRDDLAKVMTELGAAQSPVLHVLGNHCLAVGRDGVQNALGLARAYYAHELSARWRLVVLDTVDVGVDREEGHPMRVLADDFLKKHADEHNANPWNGGVGPEQLEWLADTLQGTRADGKLAIVCGHMPIFMEEEHGAVPQHSMWTRSVVGDLLTRNRDVVKAYFCGHYHQGAYVQKDEVHYVTFESIVDSQSELGSWAVVDLYDDGVVIDGHGDTTSRILKVPYAR